MLKSRGAAFLYFFTLHPPTNYRFNLIPSDATCASVTRDAPRGTQTLQVDLGVIWDGLLEIYDAREIFMEMNRKPFGCFIAVVWSLTCMYL